MVREIIELLKVTPYDEGGDAVQFAKGKNETPMRFREILRYVKDRTYGRR